MHPRELARIHLRYRLPDRVTCYHITVVNEASAVAAATLDGAALLPEQGLRVPLVSDGVLHELRLSLR